MAQRGEYPTDTTLVQATRECQLSKFKSFEFTTAKIPSAKETHTRESFIAATRAIAGKAQSSSAKGIPKNPNAQFSSAGRPALFRRPTRDKSALEAVAEFKEAVHRAKQTA